jgi:hypothetical protein
MVISQNLSGGTVKETQKLLGQLTAWLRLQTYLLNMKQDANQLTALFGMNKLRRSSS